MNKDEMEGKVEKAKEHYATAFRLFPSEENEKLLVAIEKRRTNLNPKPNASTNSSE